MVGVVDAPIWDPVARAYVCDEEHAPIWKINAEKWVEDCVDSGE